MFVERPRLESALAAFTLIELVLVMTLLVTVLTVSYKVVVDCIDTDRRIDKIAQPEKVGEGIMSLIRRDLAGTYFRQFGRRVFAVTDGGTAPEAFDGLSFLTTVKPTPSEIGADEGASEVYEQERILGVRYALQENPDISAVRAYSLYRKEMLEFDPNFPLEQSPGFSYELYDKMAYFSVECFDGEIWNFEWDSEALIQREEEELAAIAAADAGRIDRVSDPAGSRAIEQAPGVAPAADPATLPPAAVPAAVRVEFGFYSGRGNQIELDAQGDPILKTFSATVPLITAKRLRIEFDDAAALEEEGGAIGGERAPSGASPGGGAAPFSGGGAEGRPARGGRR